MVIWFKLYVFIGLWSITIFSTILRICRNDIFFSRKAFTAILFAAFKTAIVVKRLPKTRSGKILRGTIRKIADNEDYKMPPTIDDPAILTEIKEDLIKNNILKSG